MHLRAAVPARPAVEHGHVRQAVGRLAVTQKLSSGVDAEDPAGEGGYGSRYGVGSYGFDSAWGLEVSIAESKASCASNWV